MISVKFCPEILTHYRKQKELSFLQLARIFRAKYGQTKLNKQLVWSWERGKSVPSSKNLMILAHIFKTNVENFWEIDDQ
jgi:transcriptional regulator with XRE-family HTH domain